MLPRRSTRESSIPVKFGYPSTLSKRAADASTEATDDEDLLPTIEGTIKEELTSPSPSEKEAGSAGTYPQLTPPSPSEPPGAVPLFHSPLDEGRRPTANMSSTDFTLAQMAFIQNAIKEAVETARADE